MVFYVDQRVSSCSEAILHSAAGLARICKKREGSLPSSCSQTWTCRDPFRTRLCFQVQGNNGIPWEARSLIVWGAVVELCTQKREMTGRGKQREASAWVRFRYCSTNGACTHQLHNHIDNHWCSYESTQSRCSCKGWALRQEWPDCMVYAWHDEDEDEDEDWWFSLVDSSVSLVLSIVLLGISVLLAVPSIYYCSIYSCTASRTPAILKNLKRVRVVERETVETEDTVHSL